MRPAMLSPASKCLLCIAFGVLSGLPVSAMARDYPARAVALVIPYPLSGPTDIRGTSRVTKTYKLIATHAPPSISDTLARIVQQAIRYDSPHPVHLERLPGAATTRGARRVAQAPADGHTLLLGSNETMVLAPHFLGAVGYDPMRHFELVAPLVQMPFVLMASSGLPFKTLPRLLAYVKVRPGEINYGSSGEGGTGHLAGELLRRAARLEMVHISYNGGMAALNGVARGQTSLMYAALPLALPYVNSEHLHALAVASPQRSRLLPAVPTLAEAGVAAADISGWYGVFAPKGVALGRLRWLSDRIGEAVNAPSTREALLAQGLEPVRGPLSVFATRIYAESERWGPVLKAARIGARETS